MARILDSSSVMMEIGKMAMVVRRHVRLSKGSVVRLLKGFRPVAMLVLWILSMPRRSRIPLAIRCW